MFCLVCRILVDSSRRLQGLPEVQEQTNEEEVSQFHLRHERQNCNCTLACSIHLSARRSRGVSGNLDMKVAQKEHSLHFTGISTLTVHLSISTQEALVVFCLDARDEQLAQP